MPVTVNHYEARLKDRMNAKLKMCNRLLLEDIHRESLKATPLKDGDLRELVTKIVDGKSGIITWTVPYASYQERGQRYDGSHIVKHYTTPGTGKNFARNAVIKVVTPENIKRYLI